MSCITWGDIEAEDTRHLSEASFVKVFRLAQLLLEYLLYVQDNLCATNALLEQSRCVRHVGLQDATPANAGTASDSVHCVCVCTCECVCPRSCVGITSKLEAGAELGASLSVQPGACAPTQASSRRRPNPCCMPAGRRH